MKLTHQIALAAAVLLFGVSLLAAAAAFNQNRAPATLAASR
jgi:hypothetical protein